MTKPSDNKPADTGRRYDIVIFGATGFTGQLTAQYLAKHQSEHPLKWAIAGRSLKKLEQCRQSLLTQYPKANIDLVQADANDPPSLNALTASTRVVITTVGPYLKYGKPLVEACVNQATHYVDLTGEPEFVEELIFEFQDRAADKQIKIVNACGFDSVPHDLGALYTVQALNTLLGEDRAGKTAIKVEGFVQARGQFSGGTWHSAINQFSRIRQFRKKRKTWSNVKKTRPGDRRQARILPPYVKHMKAFQRWACPFPSIDPQVVKRSALVCSEYGPDFRYGHYILVDKLPTLVAGVVGTGSLVMLSQFRLSRHQLLSLKSPGQGPSPEQREKGWFKVNFIGESEGIHLWTEVSGGDPGYGETAKMLAESALCLALDTNLPDQYGIVTPAAAMGTQLIQRLQQAGITFRVL